MSRTYRALDVDLKTDQNIFRENGILYSVVLPRYRRFDMTVFQVVVEINCEEK